MPKAWLPLAAVSRYRCVPAIASLLMLPGPRGSLLARSVSVVLADVNAIFELLNQVLIFPILILQNLDASGTKGQLCWPAASNALLDDGPVPQLLLAGQYKIF